MLNRLQFDDNHAFLINNHRVRSYSLAGTHANIFGYSEALWVSSLASYGSCACEQLLSGVNHETILAELQLYLDEELISPDDLLVDSSGIVVRLYRNDDDSLGFTAAARVSISILAELLDYPLLNDTAYYERLSELQGEYIEDELTALGVNLELVPLEAWSDLYELFDAGYCGCDWSADRSSPELHELLSRHKISFDREL